MNLSCRTGLFMTSLWTDRAPMTMPRPFSYRMPFKSSQFLRLTSTSGFSRPFFILTRRSVPPARSLAFGPYSASIAQASCKVSGARYSNSGTIIPSLHALFETAAVSETAAVWRLCSQLPLRHRQFLGALPVLDLLHPRRALHELVVGQRHGRVADPDGIEFVFDLQEPLVIVGSVLRPCQVQWLVRAQERRVETLADIHLRGLHVELVDTGRILILIPVDQELGVALVTQLKALEPARVTVVRHQGR